MNTRIRDWAVATVLAAGLGSTVAACGGEEPPAPPPTTAQEYETSERFRTNARGHVPVEVGEEIVYFEDMSGDKATFVINSIQIDPPCRSASGQSPADGHLLVIGITARTSNDPQVAEDLLTLLTFDNWKMIDSKGITRNTGAASWSCVHGDSNVDAFPASFGANQTYQGRIGLVVAEPHGTLVLVNNGIPSGWELKY